MDVKTPINYRYHNTQPKKKAFIMFADLDGTFTPMDLAGKEDFVKITQEISDQCQVQVGRASNCKSSSAQVKFVPISGRPAGYVLCVLHECRDMLEGLGIHDVCDYGAAEQVSS